MQIPLYKRLFSYVWPITLSQTIGKNMTVLLLQLYRNEFMLGTPKAIYSYGTSYRPFLKTFAKLKDELPACRRFLLLGTGLGSALKILQVKYNLFPEAVLIDNDEDVLKQSMKVMNLNQQHNVQWICQDGMSYLEQNKSKFDLIGVDLFIDLLPASIIQEDRFVTACKKNLSTNGICIFNTIFTDDNDIVSMEQKLKLQFPHVEFILDRVNTYFICRN
jgi:spermidine synthase